MSAKTVRLEITHAHVACVADFGGLYSQPPTVRFPPANALILTRATAAPQRSVASVISEGLLLGGLLTPEIHRLFCGCYCLSCNNRGMSSRVGLLLLLPSGSAVLCPGVPWPWARKCNRMKRVRSAKLDGAAISIFIFKILEVP